jgi:phosphatidylglycerophosphatase A
MALNFCRNYLRLIMYKNRGRGRSSKFSTASNAGSSAVGTPASNVSASSTTSTTFDTPASSKALDTSNKRTLSPKKRGRPPGKKQSFPSEETFLAPAPSPKTLTPPMRRKPMREANSSHESSPVLNVVRRKARRACDLDTAFYERILAICGLTFELDGAIPHQLGLQIVFIFV